MPKNEPGPLKPLLEETLETLESNLESVCEAPPAHDLDTGELIKVEETLAIAAEAAKQAVSLRRRMRADAQGESPTEQLRRSGEHRTEGPRS